MTKTLAFATALLLGAGCASFDGERSSNSVLSSAGDPVVLFSDADEIALGRQTAAAALKQYKRLDNAGVQTYVNSLGQRLAALSERPNLKYEFTVLDEPDINAFAAPGGFIFITTGILKKLKDEAELAAVLGHEVGHVVKKHSLKRMQRAAVAEFGLGMVSSLLGGGKTGALVAQLGPIASNLVLLRNGREAELESDEQGLQLNQRASLAPEAMIGVQTMLMAQGGSGGGLFEELFASHPPSQQRIQQAQALLPKYEGPKDRGASRYKAQVLDKLK